MIFELFAWYIAMTGVRFMQKLGFEFKKVKLFFNNRNYWILESGYLVLVLKLCELIKTLVRSYFLLI